MAQLEQIIFDFLLSYSAQPSIVYISIAILMTLGSFGFPISEELVIISAGLMAFIGSHPEFYPDVVVGNSVTIYTAASVCFLSVFLSDVVVFTLGRLSSDTVQNNRYIQRMLSKKKMDKISKWMDRYGYFYPAIFRFIPGLRFAGHFTTGLFRFSFIKFIFVDGMAALLTVPSQVILIGIFGQPIITYLKEFILGLIVLIILSVTLVVIRKFKEIKQDLINTE